MKEIILASGSSRRKQLLEQIGLKFEVIPSNYKEDLGLDLEQGELAKKMALGKAQDVASKHKDAVVIGADTIAVFEGKVLGKPKDKAEAVKMLSDLSGREHKVVSGMVVTEAGRMVMREVVTKVFFRRLSKREIEVYVSLGEPMGKAGAYAIQGLGAVLIEKIEGDFYNVVGLPVATLAEVLKEFEVEVL